VEDNKQALASLDRLAELPADTLLRGHGDPWHGSMSDALARVRAAGTSRLHARVRRAARSDLSYLRAAKGRPDIRRAMQYGYGAQVNALTCRRPR
jgi:glyoxylase-like metal-dependent hydrolase (beta-lactamase superfamily II)